MRRQPAAISRSLDPVCRLSPRCLIPRRRWPDGLPLSWGGGGAGEEEEGQMHWLHSGGGLLPMPAGWLTGWYLCVRGWSRGVSYRDDIRRATPHWRWHSRCLSLWHCLMCVFLLDSTSVPRSDKIPSIAVRGRSCL